MKHLARASAAMNTQERAIVKAASEINNTKSKKINILKDDTLELIKIR